jgi:hypothetical protein
MRFHQPTNSLWVATFGRSMWRVDYGALDREPAGAPAVAKPRKVRLLRAGCVRNGRLRLKIATPRGERLRKVTLRSGSKKVTLTGRRTGRTVTLRVKRTAKVRLVATTRSGKRFTDSRTYRACKSKRRG